MRSEAEASPGHAVRRARIAFGPKGCGPQGCRRRQALVGFIGRVGRCRKGGSTGVGTESRSPHGLTQLAQHPG